MKAVIYLRVSTEEQTTGNGLEAQLEACKRVAQQKGYEVIDVYSDEGVSGAKDATERPALQKLIADSTGDNWNAVIFNSLDRVGRTVSIITSTIDTLAGNGKDVISVKEDINTGGIGGLVIRTIFSLLAEVERELIRERTTAGRNVRGRRDGERGGKLPAGYIRVDDGIEVDERKAEIVRQVFQTYDSEESYLGTARSLNALGVPTIRDGRQWYASSVKTIVDNRDVYEGGNRTIEIDGEIIESGYNWKPILIA